jgi:hypothetical protein
MNLSFGKIMAIFGGFLMVILIGTIVVAKLAGRAPKAVTTKTYQHNTPASAPPASAPPASAPPASAAPRPAPAPVTAEQGTAAPNVNPQPAEANAPAAMPPAATMATNANAPAIQAAGTPAAAAPMQVGQGGAANPADVMQKLSNIDNKLAELTSRIAVLEAKKTPATEAAPHHAGASATHRKTARRTPAKPQPVEVADNTSEKQSPALAGYKTMAVVGNRAWIRTSEGVEDSVTVGDPLPRPRVRSIDRDKGVVIMSSDERVDAR